MYHSIMNSTKSQIRFIPRFGLYLSQKKKKKDSVYIYIYNFIFLYICDENYNNYFLLLESLMSIIKEAKCYHYPSYLHFFFLNFVFRVRQIFVCFSFD